MRDTAKEAARSRAIEPGTVGPQRRRYEITLPHVTETGPVWFVIERSPAEALAGDDWNVIASAGSYTAARLILEAVQVVS